jgi:hypothetical protein
MERKNIIRDIGIIFLSIILAISLIRTGTLDKLFLGLQDWQFLGAILAGIFFVSIFTAVPASVVLFEMATVNSVWFVAFWGAIGCLIGDLIIFRFVKDNLSESMMSLVRESRKKRIMSIFELKIFRWVIPLLGALIVASPLPDEIGLMMMGFAQMKIKWFIPTSFILNFFGILILSLMAK